MRPPHKIIIETHCLKYGKALTQLFHLIGSNMELNLSEDKTVVHVMSKLIISTCYHAYQLRSSCLFMRNKI